MDQPQALRTRYIDELLARGRACFSKDEAVAALGLSSEAFTAAVGRLARKHRVASPRRGFYLILRPEAARTIGQREP